MTKEDAFVSNLDDLFDVDVADFDRNTRRYGIPSSTERTRMVWKYGSGGHKTSQARNTTASEGVVENQS